MRSRYSGYAAARVDWILATTHPDGPHWEPDRDAWFAEVERFCRDVSFDGLEVIESRVDGARGHVSFRAQMSRGGRTTVMAERSLFVKKDGHWLYHSGTRLDP